MTPGRSDCECECMLHGMLTAYMCSFGSRKQGLYTERDSNISVQWDVQGWWECVGWVNELYIRAYMRRLCAHIDTQYYFICTVSPLWPWVTLTLRIFIHSSSVTASCCIGHCVCSGTSLLLMWGDRHWELCLVHLASNPLLLLCVKM